MKIQGVELVEFTTSSDMRGRSMKIYSKGNGYKGFECNEIFISESKKNVIRGLHFQPYPYGQRKIITVLKGRIEGVILDLRKHSDTYGEYMSIIIDETDTKSLYVPEYCAWGFKALGEHNTLVYNISGDYNKEYDKGICWDSIGYDWQVEAPVISDRDKNLIKLQQYLEGVENE